MLKNGIAKSLLRTHTKGSRERIPDGREDRQEKETETKNNISGIFRVTSLFALGLDVILNFPGVVHITNDCYCRESPELKRKILQRESTEAYAVRSVNVCSEVFFEKGSVPRSVISGFVLSGATDPVIADLSHDRGTAKTVLRRLSFTYW